MRVATGEAVPMNARGIPAALSLRMIALRMPGPHHSVADDTPPDIPRYLISTLLSPAVTCRTGSVPNRRGRSAEAVPTCHGEANCERVESVPGMIWNGRFSLVVNVGINA